MASKALEGLRVVDLTVWFQGPVAAQHLADFGAEVIKVERPKTGDQGRGVRSIKALPVGDWNQYFLVINRNKKSLALDLKTPGGRKIMSRLVERSDVFLTNLTSDNLEAWELTYDKLSAVNPKLIYVTTTGYGRYGTISKPSFDMTVQALTGLMARLGEPDEPPIYLGMGSGDAYGGLMAAFGIMLGVHHRNRTGRGQEIDASLYGAQLFLAAPSLQAFLASGSEEFSRQQSRTSRPNPLWNLYKAADKWLMICLENTDSNWTRFMEALGHPADLVDGKFDTVSGRRDNRGDLISLLDERFVKDSADQWITRLLQAGIASSPVNNLAELAADPQAWANHYFMKTHCEEVNREVEIRGMPISLSKTPGTVENLGPELGQETEIIMMDTLEYSWDEIEAFKAEGAIP